MEVKVVEKSFKDKDTQEVKHYDVVVFVTPFGEIPCKFNTPIEKRIVIEALKGE